MKRVNIRYLDRPETKKIVVLHTPYVTYEDFFVSQRAKGNLDSGVHYYIDKLGRITVGREENVYGSHLLAGKEDSIFVAVADKPTDCARQALELLMSDIICRYGGDLGVVDTKWTIMQQPNNPEG